MIYLDNNATTMVCPEAREAMIPFFSEVYGNPSSSYSLGARAKRAVEEARIETARSLGAKSEREIVFTSGGTESNNMAIRSALRASPGRRRIVTTEVEHPSVRNLCRSLESEGYEVSWIPVSRAGALDWDRFCKAFSDDAAVVSVMWANNETGVLFPIEKIAPLVKEKGILLHVDAVQAAGKIAIDLSKTPVDFLSIGAHKFHGPKGAGALFVREGAPCEPLLIGGKQERGRRAGTEHVPGIAGLACALKFAVEAITREMPRIGELRNRLESELIRRIPESSVNGQGEPRIPNTTYMTLPGIESEPFLIRLSEAGIFASSGSACLTGAIEPSHVLKAMGQTDELALSSVRFSLSRFTTAEEIDHTIEEVPKLVKILREFNSVR